MQAAKDNVHLLLDQLPNRKQPSFVIIHGGKYYYITQYCLIRITTDCKRPVGSLKKCDTLK